MICRQFSSTGSCANNLCITTFAKCTYLQVLHTVTPNESAEVKQYCLGNSNKKMSTSLTMNNKPLRQVLETSYLGVVLTDDIFCAEDDERAKSGFV